MKRKMNCDEVKKDEKCVREYWLESAENDKSDVMRNENFFTWDQSGRRWLLGKSGLGVRLMTTENTK